MTFVSLMISLFLASFSVPEVFSLCQFKVGSSLPGPFIFGVRQEQKVTGR